MASLVRRVLVLLLVVVLTIVAVVVLFPGDTSNPRLVPGTGADNDPLAYTQGREDEFAAAAARGHAHVIYAKSPGGARASAERVAQYRPLVETAAETADIDPDTLEGLVLLESAGRADAAADPQLEGAVGLTQILAETGRNLLDMQVDPAGARRIGRSLRRAQRRGDRALVDRLQARRRLVDERFDPPKALAATARYLVIAREALGRADLAVQSYHMGIGNLQSALRDYGEDDISYARLYFDSTPIDHEKAYRRLAALGDDSATYLWRVMAAREIAPIQAGWSASPRCRTPRTPPRSSCIRRTRRRRSRHPTTCATHTPTAASSRCRGRSCSSGGSSSTVGWASWRAV
jgi:hypothetical protein